jgi:hypothetical protein
MHQSTRGHDGGSVYLILARIARSCMLDPLLAISMSQKESIWQFNIQYLPFTNVYTAQPVRTIAVEASLTG